MKGGHPRSQGWTGADGDERSQEPGRWGATLARENCPSPVRARGSGRGRVNRGEARRCRCETHVRRRPPLAVAVGVGRTGRNDRSYPQAAGAGPAWPGRRFSSTPDRVGASRSGRAHSRHRRPPDSGRGCGRLKAAVLTKPRRGLANRPQSRRSGGRTTSPGSGHGGSQAGRSSG